VGNSWDFKSPISACQAAIFRVTCISIDYKQSSRLDRAIALPLRLSIRYVVRAEGVIGSTWWCCDSI